MALILIFPVKLTIASQFPSSPPFLWWLNYVKLPMFLRCFSMFLQPTAFTVGPQRLREPRGRQRRLHLAHAAVRGLETVPAANGFEKGEG